MVLEVMRAIGRRWYVALVGLILTAGLVFGAYTVSPPEYNARALVLLLPSKTDVGPGGNPFLQLSGLEQPASILAAYFSSAPSREDVKAQASTASYEVALDSTTRGPVLAVDVTAESSEDATLVLNYLLQRMPEELTRLQEDVEARRNAFVGSMVLTIDRQPERVLSGTIRLMIAALVVGVVSTGFAAVALDGYLLRRNRRRSGDLDESEVETGESNATVVDDVPARRVIGAATTDEVIEPPVISAHRPPVETQPPGEVVWEPEQPSDDGGDGADGKKGDASTNGADGAAPKKDHAIANSAAGAAAAAAKKDHAITNSADAENGELRDDGDASDSSARQESAWSW